MTFGCLQLGYGLYQRESPDPLAGYEDILLAPGSGMQLIAGGPGVGGLALEDDQLSPVWQSWTPTTANITLGAGAITARYELSGDTVHFHFSFLLGSGSAVGTSPSFTLPFALNSTYINNSKRFLAHAEDAGNQSYLGTTNTTTTTGVTTAVPVIYGTASTYATPVTITSTVPFTWGAADYFSVEGWYERA